MLHGTVGSIMRRSIDRSGPYRTRVHSRRTADKRDGTRTCNDFTSPPPLFPLPSVSLQKMQRIHLDTDDVFDGTRNSGFGKIRRKILFLDRESKGKSVVQREKEREFPSVSKVNAVEAVESTFIGCKFTGAITGRYNAGY